MTAQAKPDLTEDTPQDASPEGEAQIFDWPDPDEVRAQLIRILDEVKGIDDVPWRAARRSLHRLLYVQLTTRLPEEEGEQLCREFDEELKRLEAA